VPNVDLQIWEKCFREDYLASYIRDGGASVKVVVGEDEVRRRVRQVIADAAADFSTRVYDLCDAQIDLHRVEQLWFAIARATDWEKLIGEFVRKNMSDAGYPLDDPNIPCTIRAIRDNYGATKQEVSKAFLKAIRGQLWRNYGLEVSFRIALTSLCDIYFEHGSLDDIESDVFSWLKGDPVMARDLQMIGIFRKIDMTLARDIVASFFSWHYANFGPSILFTDLAPFYAKDPGRNRYLHPKARVFQLYEVIREFIDELHLTRGVVFVFLAPHDLITSPDRSYAIYPALQTRIADEVRDRTYGNPCATLVTVA
jgi:hypothetical protein